MKKQPALLLAALCLAMLTACGAGADLKKDFGTLQWPDSDIAALLPQPESELGKTNWEREDGFSLYIGNISKEKYNAYVDACRENGFTVDYSKGDDYYYADNADGYDLSLQYRDGNIMYLSISAPSEDVPDPISTPEETPPVEEVLPEETPSAEPAPAEEPENTQESVPEPTPEPAEPVAEGLRPEFKEAMDSYEAFMDEYVAFMKKYNETDDTGSMLLDYAAYIAKYADAVAKLDEIDEDSLTEEEMRYYTDVNLRVAQKLNQVV